MPTRPRPRVSATRTSRSTCSRRSCVEFKRIYKEQLGVDFPEDVWEQLSQAIEAVFQSWFGERAATYRRYNKIPDDWGTAVNICTMVFGNMGEDSGTGVAFTRNPSTGEKALYGEYLANAQGEDVVAGTRTPLKIAELERVNKAIYDQFVEVASMLERHYRDMQDMEFTVEKGKLWMLQMPQWQAYRARGDQDRRRYG